jgi:hypothetical protein
MHGYIKTLATELQVCNFLRLKTQSKDKTTPLPNFAQVTSTQVPTQLPCDTSVWWKCYTSACTHASTQCKGEPLSSQDSETKCNTTAVLMTVGIAIKCVQDVQYFQWDCIFIQYSVYIFTRFKRYWKEEYSVIQKVQKFLIHVHTLSGLFLSHIDIFFTNQPLFLSTSTSFLSHIDI